MFILKLPFFNIRATTFLKPKIGTHHLKSGHNVRNRVLESLEVCDHLAYFCNYSYKLREELFWSFNILLNFKSKSSGLLFCRKTLNLGLVGVSP